MPSYLPAIRSYQHTHQRIQVGDIIAFGGNSLFSRWTKLTTGSVVTHIAVVSTVPDSEDGGGLKQLVEATKYKGRSGVMVNSLCERIDNYNGDIWWLPIDSKARQRLRQNQHHFMHFLEQQQHKKYDIWQLFGSAVDLCDKLPLLNRLTQNREDFTKLFCSELVAQALEVANVIGCVNASETTPIDICRLKIFEQHYVQLKGKQKTIEGFNTILASDWGYANQ